MLIFSQSYLSCQVLGLCFSYPWCLGFERPSLLCSRLPAHFGRGGFGPSQVSNQASRTELLSQGPLPAWARTQLPSQEGPARANTMNKVVLPWLCLLGEAQPFPQQRKERSLGKPKLLFRKTKRRKEGRKKHFFQTWTTQCLLLRLLQGQNKGTDTE